MNNCFGCAYLDLFGHTGEDFDDGREGDPVYAASEGVVVWTGTGPGAWGNVTIIQHLVQGHIIYTQYAHQRAILVAPGQVVGRRQQIGIVGTTGTVAPHLHFEVKDQPVIGHGYTGWNFSGLTVYEPTAGINYWQPTWFIQAHRVLDSPFGYIDGVQLIPGGFKLWGWAIDPNTGDPINVHVYLDGVGVLALRADQARPDVGAAYPAYGPNHGYGAGIQAGLGKHQVCVYGINIGPGVNSLIECETIDITGDPFGGLDSVSLTPGGAIEVSGWAIDPDTTEPIDVKIYVNGQFAGQTGAGDARADIAARFQEYGGSHGFTIDTGLYPGDNQVCVYGVNVGNGADALLGCRNVYAGLDEFPVAPPPPGRHYYWTWYDSNNGVSDWLLLASPFSGGQNLGFDVNLQGRAIDFSPGGNATARAGQTIFTNYHGVSGGPLVATSLNGAEAVSSQRILWGASLEEVPGTDEEQLSSHFYWPWYDMASPGYQNWILVSNPSAADTVHAEISFINVADGARITAESDIAPGENWNPVFPGKMGGPVEVRAYLAGGTWPADERDVMASQRVLSNFGRAFNEVPGIPAAGLSDRYIWTWYDMKTPGFADWVLIANPDPVRSVTYQVSIGGIAQACPPGGCSIPPGGMVTPVFPGELSGPVEVSASAPVISSQRVLAGPSFEEVPGSPVNRLASDYHWTWYDMQSPQSANWILIANPNDNPVDYQIKIGGMDAPAAQGGGGTIPAHGFVTPVFPGTIGGPVEVMSAGGSVLASQRVMWGPYFNEVTGTVLQGTGWRLPALHVSRSAVYWASYSDFTGGQLSVDYSVSNTGTSAAAGVYITDAQSTNGVTAGNLPISLGGIGPGAGITATVRYHIPAGTGSFMTSLQLTVVDPAGTVQSCPLWNGGAVLVPSAP